MVRYGVRSSPASSTDRPERISRLAAAPDFFPFDPDLLRHDRKPVTTRVGAGDPGSQLPLRAAGDPAGGDRRGAGRAVPISWNCDASHPVQLHHRREQVLQGNDIASYEGFTRACSTRTSRGLGLDVVVVRTAAATAGCCSSLSRQQAFDARVQFWNPSPGGPKNRPVRALAGTRDMPSARDADAPGLGGTPVGHVVVASGEPVPDATGSIPGDLWTQRVSGRAGRFSMSGRIPARLP